MQSDSLSRCRCQVGHAYSIESMMADQADGIERALWAALRALEERVSLAERMAARAREHSHTHLMRRFEETVRENKQHADVLKEVLLKNNSTELLRTMEAEEKEASALQG